MTTDLHELPPSARILYARTRLNMLARELYVAGMRGHEIRQAFAAMTLILERLERREDELKAWAGRLDDA